MNQQDEENSSSTDSVVDITAAYVDSDTEENEQGLYVSNGTDVSTQEDSHIEFEEDTDEDDHLTDTSSTLSEPCGPIVSADTSVTSETSYSYEIDCRPHSLYNDSGFADSDGVYRHQDEGESGDSDNGSGGHEEDVLSVHSADDGTENSLRSETTVCEANLLNLDLASDATETELGTQSPCIPPPVVEKPMSFPTIEEYQRELLRLSRSAWGTPGRNALEQLDDDAVSIDALRTGNADVLSQYISPFSSERQNPKKRRTISAVFPEAKRVPYLDKHALSITYKNSLENEKVLAKNLGGWNTLLTLRGQLASIDRDFLELLLLETCCTEPRLVSKIADCCIKTSNRSILRPRCLN